MDISHITENYFNLIHQCQELQNAVNEVKDKLSLYSNVIEKTVNMVCISDVSGKIEYVNSTFEDVTGYSKDDVIGKDILSYISEVMNNGYSEMIQEMINKNNIWTGTLKNKRKNGEYYWSKCKIYPVLNKQREISHLLAIQEDITAERSLEEKVRHLISCESIDRMTGLLTRSKFIELLNQWVSSARDKGFNGVLLIMNIDNFRLINDAFGNKAGDGVLIQCSMFLKSFISDRDTEFFSFDVNEHEIMESLIGYMGSDEFAIFLHARGVEDGMTTAEMLRLKVMDLDFIDFPGHITVSIGGVSFQSQNESAYEMLNMADAALNKAKEEGRNTWHIYKPDDLLIEKMHKRLSAITSIHKGLRSNSFIPWFQPIYNIKNNYISHYEALLRKYGEDGKIIMPGDLIETAEITGLIGEMDRIIIEKTMHYASHLKLNQSNGASFSVNLSGKDLTDYKMIEFLKVNMFKHGVVSNDIIFEITETSAINNILTAMKFINEMKSEGYKFALDDFGVGFSSFKYLQEMQIDYIKIDGSFIKKLTESNNDRLFVKAMVEVAHGMGIKAIAEFVENKETFEILIDLDVDYAQGYYIGKPAPEIQLCPAFLLE